jgi:hypothetical protein
MPVYAKRTWTSGKSTYFTETPEMLALKGNFNTYLHKPPMQNRGFVLAPGLTNTPDYSNFLANTMLPELAKYEKHPDADRYGLVGMSRCYNFPGFSMDPIGLPMFDPEVQNATLLDEYCKFFELVASHIIPIMRKHRYDVALSLRRKANGGPMAFSTSSLFRDKCIRHMIENIDDFAEALEADRYEYLEREYGWSALAAVRRRHQADSVEVVWNRDHTVVVDIVWKKRRVNDGKGSFIDADKSLPKEYNQSLCANRERKVIAVNFINNILEVIESAMWTFVARTYPHYWHVASAHLELEAFAEAYAERRPLSADVHGYDLTQSLSYLDFQAHIIAKYLGQASWAAKMSLISNAPPYVSPPTWFDGSDGPHAVGDRLHPLLGREQRAIGLPSGKGRTAWAHGKLANGIAVMYAWFKALDISLTWESARAYLKHDPRMPVWGWDCGDDVSFWVLPSVTANHEAAFTDAYHAICKAWSLEIDQYPSFLSYQIRAAGRAWDAYPDAARSITNLVDRENSLPRFWATGVPTFETYSKIVGLSGQADPEIVGATNLFGNYGTRARREIISALNPMYAEIEDHVMYLWDTFKPGTSDSIKKAAQYETIALDMLQVDAHAASDIEALTQPHHLFFVPGLEENISDSVRSMIFISYTPDEIKPLVDAAYPHARQLDLEDERNGIEYDTIDAAA